MKSKIMQTIKNKKIQIALMECLVAIGCVIVLFVMTMAKYNLLDTTYSYSKVNTEVSEYSIEGNYMTRVMPLTQYEAFKKIAETTLNKKFKEKSYSIKVYVDENRTKEMTSGYIASGMVVVAIPKDDENINKTETIELPVNEKTENDIETEKKVEETIDKTSQEIIGEEKTKEIAEESEKSINTTEEIAYTISVIGDFTKDGDINVTELTKIIKCVVGLNNWNFTEEEKIAADLNNDGSIDIADVECCINYIVFGNLEVKEKEYTITFKNYDGKVLSTKTDYHKGDTVEIPENPTREADEIYYYEFSGWTPEVSTIVTGNAEYIATYRAVANKSKYKVEHYKEKLDGTYELAETEELAETTGKEVTATKKEYTGFSEDTENEERKVSGIVSGDGSLTLKLFYKRNQYTVTLTKDENIERVSLNGENIETKNYKYGESVSINAELKEEAGYNITFNKWVSSNTILIEDQINKATTIEIPEGNIELKATTNKTANEVSYKVEHYKEKLDGTYELAETEDLAETTGKEVTATKKEYTGFSEDTENKERKVSGIVSGDGSLTLKLFYKRNQYTVTFIDYNGTEISKIKYKYEEVINVPEDPTREADEIYTYEFLGWSPEVNEIAIEDVQYTAQYKATYIKYHIIFKNYEGTIISSKEDYHYGDTVEVPENPTREADDNYEYEFAGWDKEVTTVTKDEVYTATYHEIPYTILVKKADGRVEKYTSFKKAFETITDENINIQLIGDVTESVIIPEDKNVTLDLNNHKITSDQDATITNHATLLIVDNSIEKGGSIENTRNTAIVNNGDLTLGYDDGVVEDNILIKGQTNAIQNNETFHMYDGTLMGKSTILGNNAIIPEGEEYGLSVREEDGFQIATIKIIEIPEALVGETYYKTLQQAIDENNNETIYVIKKNVELIGSVTIDETKNLTIDLNGNNIESSSTTYVIENAGTLTITNTNESRVGSINSSKGRGIHNTANLKMKNVNVNSASYGVYNEKDLDIEDVNIKGGRVYNEHPSNDINFTMTRGSLSSIENSKGSNSIGGNINIQITAATINGELSTDTSNARNSKIMVEMINTTIKSKTYGIRSNGSNIELQLKESRIQVESNDTNYGIYYLSGVGKITLENTEVNVNTTSGYSYGIYNEGNGGSADYNIVIDKNTQIIANSENSTSYGIYSENSYRNQIYKNHIQLLNGKISSIGKRGYGVFLKAGIFDFLGGSIHASTQTIDAMIGSIAGGKQIQTLQEETGYVSTLIDAVRTEYVATVGEEKFYSLKDAVDACKNLQESTKIEMLSDYEQTQSLEISSEKNIILDLKGYQITTYGEFINEGKFEITDTSIGQTGIIEEKTGRAILNKGNAIFTLSGGKILLNSATLAKTVICNTDQASINIKNGILEIDNKDDSGRDNYIIYNVSTGNIEITAGILKGNASNNGDLYGIYNLVDDVGGDRNINISGGNIELSDSNSYFSASVYAIYNSTTHDSRITDTSRDTININISNYNISVKGSKSGGAREGYGIYNTTEYGRDTIKVNLQNTIVDVTNTSDHSEAYGIYNRASSSQSSFIYNNIEGGSIQATGKNKTNRCYGIYNSGGNIAINLGTKGENNNTLEPKILGHTYGIYCDSTNTINFFQGMIKGTEAISPITTLTLEEGKEINRYIDETDHYDTIVIQNKTAEAKIGETEYMTLQEAIDECPDETEEFTTIELMKEINNNAQIVTVGNTKKVTIDLKGYNLTSLSEQTIINNGDLNIIDTVGTGEIKNNVKIAIGNYGKLSMNKVKVYGYTCGITNYSKANAELNQVEIDSNSKGIDNNTQANMIINTSKIILEKGIYGIYNNGNVDIIESEISVTNGSSLAYGIYINSGIVNVGEKDSNTQDETIITSSHIGIYNDSDNSVFNYYGGSVTAGERVIRGAIDDTPKNKTIFIDEKAQTMSLMDKQEKNVVQMEGVSYSSLSEAVKTVPGNQEEATFIKVIDDFDLASAKEQVDIIENQKVKLDLNGHTITSYRKNVIKNSGKLEIMDSSELQEGKLISVFNTGISNQGEFILDQGTIQALRYGIYNHTKGNVTTHDGIVEVLAKDRGSSAGIYASGIGNIRLLGGTIKAINNEGKAYIAGMVLSNAHAEIDGGDILVNNSTEYDTYGIMTDRSIIEFKSGNMEVVSSRGLIYGISGKSSSRYDENDVRISGGNIKVLSNRQAAYGIYLESNNNPSMLTMTGGTIESSATAITGYSNKEQQISINISGGNIIAKSSAISGSTRTDITIGSKDGNMIRTDPVIEGNTYGISGGNLKFYDGTIRGKTALEQFPLEVEAGYKLSIASSGELQSATLTLISNAEAIAQIGNLYFNDLQQAINACKASDTIHILTAIQCNKTLTIEEGKTVTIDLMGNTLSANGIENIIINYGNLTIIDSIGGGSITGEIDNKGELNR